jgi:hypothetical protein
MYNDNLKSTIEANKLAISALRAQLATVAEDVEKVNNDIQRRFNHHISAYNTQYPVIPARMMSTLKCHISDSLIRLRWNDYSQKDNSNSLDIYYYSNEHYDQRGTDNHRWEISTSSNRLIVNTTEAGWAKQDGEDIDRVKLSLGMFELINTTSKNIIGYHTKYAENQSRAYDLQAAISKLERDIVEAEKRISYNTVLRLFKPGGETAVCRFNQDIVFPTTGSYGARSSRRNGRRSRYSSGLTFDAICILKEGKKGLRVEFVRYSEIQIEGQERQRWVSGTKWVTLNSLICLYQSVEESHNERIKRDAEREERRKAELLKTQTN